jgi:hypothetical protein
VETSSPKRVIRAIVKIFRAGAMPAIIVMAVATVGMAIVAWGGRIHGIV